MIYTLKRNINYYLNNEDISKNIKQILFRVQNILVASDEVIRELQTMTLIV